MGDLSMGMQNDSIRAYRALLDQGTIRQAYRGIMGFMSGLRNGLEARYPDYAVGALYPGCMDMTFFACTPPELKALQLKVAIVYLHGEGRFEAWLGGGNRKVQAEWIRRLGQLDTGPYRLSRAAPGVDSILESVLEAEPDFDRPDELRNRIEERTMAFIRDVGSWLDTGPGDVEDRLARSLTAGDVGLIPFLPYLLQDLWELGSSPAEIVEMASRCLTMPKEARVLDLACGKGAVSVRLARDLGCRVKGIDLLPDFVRYADNKASEFGVASLCQFVVGDINRAVERETEYDMVILGAVGDVLGGPEETLAKLGRTIRRGGFLLIDDAYADDESDGVYHSRGRWMASVRAAGMVLVDERVADRDELSSLNREQQDRIARRAAELRIRYPDKASLFDGYVESQQAECDDLETRITGVTLLLQA